MNRIDVIGCGCGECAAKEMLVNFLKTDDLGAQFGKFERQRADTKRGVPIEDGKGIECEKRECSHVNCPSGKRTAGLGWVTSAGASGRRRVKVAPSPSLLRTVSVPPCF